MSPVAVGVQPENIIVDAPPAAKAAPTYHPLDALTAEEISAITLAVRQHTTTQTNIKATKFVTCSIIAPPKKDVLAFLGIPLAPGGNPEAPPAEIKRQAEIDFINPLTGDNFNATLTFSTSWKVDGLTKLPEGMQPQITVDELLECEDALRKDPQVVKLAAEVGVAPDQLYADGWTIGYDDRFPQKTRMQQCLLFARFSESKDDNLYAHPMDFFPILNSDTFEVMHIDFASHRTMKGGELSAETTAPPTLEANSFEAAGRERIMPPVEQFEYLPEFLEKQEGFKGMRTDLKPLHVVQPEGVSFKMTGNVIEWQKWKMHIAFTGREGIVLSTVTYNDDGEVRPLFYRMALVELVVPYAAPEHPHPRKFAFDFGEYGMGTQVNDLTLGCDCLGKIHYLPGAYVRENGQPTLIENAICIHEEDAGILWKHTDFRKGGRAHTVRSRRLVISMICTVANYEYAFYWYFYQDGRIELETKLTGMLNSYLLAEGESPAPYGTAVAPRINAQYHQHLFSLRLDPMIDGLSNSVLETDIVPSPHPTGHPLNHAGNAFTTSTTTLTHPSTGGRSYNAQTDRRWTIINPARKHYASGSCVGYQIDLRGATQEVLARDDSWVVKRAPFLKKQVWVVKDNKEERNWPAGKYVPQTKEAPADSVVEWTKDDGTLENEDLLVFLTVGVNHIPRPEDWPVMPVEHLRVGLRPVSFFKQNPSLDVPGDKDKHSAEAFEDTNATSRDGCCH